MSEKIKLLVADDDEMVLNVLSDFLIEQGFDVTTAINGTETLEAIEKCSPDLLVLDIVMPGQDGLAVCEILRKSEAHSALPILMLTGQGETTSIVDALEKGADDYVTKPFKNTELLTKITQLLSQAKEGKLPSQLAAKKNR